MSHLEFPFSKRFFPFCADLFSSCEGIRKKREKNDKTEKMTLLNEKNSIQQIPDIIELNVGGQNFTTR